MNISFLCAANVKASSSAANLYAALAADVLGDIDGMEEEEVLAPVPTTSPITTFPAVPTVAASTPAVVESPSQQLYLTPGHNPRQQILLTTSQAGLAPRVSIMNAGGQQYFVTPQTAIVQVSPSDKASRVKCNHWLHQRLCDRLHSMWMWTCQPSIT